MLRSILAATLSLAALPAAAQTVLPCEGWRVSVRNLAEPWEQSMRTFANGAIRVALIDTVEPAAGAYYLLVLTPPRDEMGNRTCGLVAANAQTGFSGLNFGSVQPSYDPATGLTLRFPAQVFAPDTGGFDPAILAVTINQASGAITPRYEIP